MRATVWFGNGPFGVDLTPECSEVVDVVAFAAKEVGVSLPDGWEAHAACRVLSQVLLIIIGGFYFG